MIFFDQPTPLSFFSITQPSSKRASTFSPDPSALSRAGAQPLRLSLLHLGKLRPSQVWLEFLIGWRIWKNCINSDPSARSLIAYMSGARLKKGAGCSVPNIIQTIPPSREGRILLKL